MYYRCKLPHYQPLGGTFFITYRLYSSIPQNVICQLENERNKALDLLHKQFAEKRGLHTPKEERIQILNIHKKHFAKYDNWLDKSNGSYWLQEPLIANIVQESLQHCAAKYYDLWASTIMSNHVHILITLKKDAPILYEVLQNHKKFTGRQANKVLQRTGKRFWEKESYDHLVRYYDKNAFGNIVAYIVNNPIKAGLVKNWEDWPYTFLHPDL